jgi:hypothetical protein
VSRIRLECPCERGETIAFEPIKPCQAAGDATKACPARGCEQKLELHLDGLSEPEGGGVGLLTCCKCGHPELYSRKDFPPALGIGLVAIAALLVPFTPYYSSLFVAAIIDALLYHFAPDVVECYVCATEHRGFVPEPRHPGFDRTIEERLLYGEKAVMGSPMREGGTAGAPDPEH